MHTLNTAAASTESSPVFSEVSVDKATDTQINWLVAKCQGHAVGVMTGAEVMAHHLQHVFHPKRIAAIQATFANAAPEICFINASGRKERCNLAMLADTGFETPQYVTNWFQTGPILTEMIAQGFELKPATFSAKFQCIKVCRDERVIAGYGPTPFHAVLRAYIESVMGPVVEVPIELAVQSMVSMGSTVEAMS